MTSIVLFYMHTLPVFCATLQHYAYLEQGFTHNRFNYALRNSTCNISTCKILHSTAAVSWIEGSLDV